MTSQPSKSFAFLYVVFTIYCTVDRLWIYLMPFAVERLEGLRLVGFSLMLQSALSMLLSSFLGGQLDSHNRLKGALTTMVSNTSSTVLSSACLMLCHIGFSGALYHILLISAVLMASVGKVASDGELMVLNKDWVVVMASSEGAKDSTLAVRNAAMVTIYQTSSIVAPILGGVAVSYLGVTLSCALFITLSLIAAGVKAALLRTIYRNVPTLAERNVQYKVSVIDSESEPEVQPKKRSPLKVYRCQTVFAAAFGQAALYFTVFQFDALVVGYAESCGISSHVVGTFGSVNAVCGLLGSFLYTSLERKINARKSGLVGMALFFLCVLPCVISLFLPGGVFSGVHSQQAVFVYLAGVCLGRLGFWMTHMAIQQIMQETVPESHRSAVFGVQNAACQLFIVLKNLLITFVPGNSTFSFLIIASAATVVLVELSYAHYIRRERRISGRSVVPVAENLNA